MPELYTISNGALAHETFAELAAHEWGAQTVRPWVYFIDGHRAMEKALWCYERGMVPLITERDPALASMTALRWTPDQLITDAPSLSELAPYVREHTSLRVVSVVGAIDGAAPIVPPGVVLRTFTQ